MCCESQAKLEHLSSNTRSCVCIVFGDLSSGNAVDRIINLSVTQLITIEQVIFKYSRLPLTYRLLKLNFEDFLDYH